MAWFGKYLTVCLVVLLVVTSTTQLTGNAQTITKPSVPEFSLKLADHSYDIPLTYTYSTDPYTGQEIKTPHGGQHVENLTIDIAIKNQPVSANLYYNIRVKGHFAPESEWKELYSPYSDRNREGDYFCYQISPIQLSSQYTVISYPIANYPVKGQVDFQVQALEGTFTQFYPYALISAYGYQFKGELSGWSNTQTIALSENSASPSPTAIPTNTP
jgi:hypothetical protein